MTTPDVLNGRASGLPAPSNTVFSIVTSLARTATPFGASKPGNAKDPLIWKPSTVTPLAVMSNEPSRIDSPVPRPGSLPATPAKAPRMVTSLSTTTSSV